MINEFVRSEEAVFSHWALVRKHRNSVIIDHSFSDPRRFVTGIGNNIFHFREIGAKSVIQSIKCNAGMRQVFAYLCKTRGISSEIVSQLAHDKLLYQDKKGNAVFVHRDENGNAVGAEIQGTNSEKRYKGVAQGTSESVFAVKIGEPKKCYVFESAIDLLSFKQLANPEKINNSVLVSMAGLKLNSLKSITEKGIKMYSCVDNDGAGISFTAASKFTPCRRILEENGVKDYNELLQKIVREQQKIQTKPPQVSDKKSSKASHSHR